MFEERAQDAARELEEALIGELLLASECEPIGGIVAFAELGAAPTSPLCERGARALAREHVGPGRFREEVHRLSQPLPVERQQTLQLCARACGR